MNARLFVVSKSAERQLWVPLIIIALTGLSFAQTISGTLTSSITSTTTSGTCSVRVTSFAWTFTDNLNVAHTFPNPSISELLLGCSASCNPRGLKSGCTTLCGCPPSGSTSTVNEWSSDGRFWLEATGGSGTVNKEAGYVNPKFVVVGVTYAPPGPSPSTSVAYTNSSFVGTTESLSHSFTGTSSQSVTLTKGLHLPIPLVAHGSISNTFATGSTQTTNSSSTVTSSIQVSSGERTFGTADYFAPVNNDYDLIWVWLNPVAIFSINAGTPLPDWGGYGADSTDQNGLDIVPVALGYLNGDFGPIPPDIQTRFDRSWAVNQVFPAGQGSALDATDLAQIASADPFSVSTYGPTEIGSNPPLVSTADNRFTLTTCTDSQNVASNNFNYLQAPPSTTADIVTCSLSYTNLSTQAQGISNSHTQSFSTDLSLAGSGFLIDFSASLQTQNTLTWMTSAQNSITTSTTSTASLSVQGPPCNNVMPGVGPCVPVYDVNGDQPTEFMVYQDNMFGTFMFAPVHFYP